MCLTSSPIIPDVALQDYTKYAVSPIPVFWFWDLPRCRRWKVGMNPPEADADKPSPHLPAGPKKDYSLKDNQTFSISIPGKTKNAQSSVVSDLFGSGSSNSGGSGGGAFPLLPPPPGR